MIITDEEKRITAFHEAGHALVAALLPGADPLHKVTIIPRGMALGVTQQLPTEEKHNYTKEQLREPHRRCAWAAASPRSSSSTRSPPAPPTTSSRPPRWRARWCASGA